MSRLEINAKALVELSKLVSKNYNNYQSGLISFDGYKTMADKLAKAINEIA